MTLQLRFLWYVYITYGIFTSFWFAIVIYFSHVTIKSIIYLLNIMARSNYIREIRLLLSFLVALDCNLKMIINT